VSHVVEVKVIGCHVWHGWGLEETQRGQRLWLAPSAGAGRRRGLLAASHWSPESALVVGRGPD